MEAWQMYQVISAEAGEPPPPGRGHEPKYPFHTLKLGESFEVPAEAVNGANQARHYWAKRTGYTFSSRKSQIGRRYWRVA